MGARQRRQGSRTIGVNDSRRDAIAQLAILLSQCRSGVGRPEPGVAAPCSSVQLCLHHLSAQRARRAQAHVHCNSMIKALAQNVLMAQACERTRTTAAEDAGKLAHGSQPVVCAKNCSITAGVHRCIVRRG